MSEVEGTETKTDPVDATLKAPMEPWYKTAAGYEVDETSAKVLGKYGSNADALKALVSAQPVLHEKVAFPKDDASPEDRAKAVRQILTRLGAPEKPDAYKLDESIPESIRANAHYGEYRDELGKVLVENGVLPDTFAKILALENKYAEVFSSDYKKSKDEGIKALKSQVGEKWDEYKANAVLAATKFGSESLAGLIGAEENPALIAMAHELWDARLREGELKKGQPVPLPPAEPKLIPFSKEWYAKPVMETARS